MRSPPRPAALPLPPQQHGLKLDTAQVPLPHAQQTPRAHLHVTVQLSSDPPPHSTPWVSSLCLPQTCLSSNPVLIPSKLPRVVLSYLLSLVFGFPALTPPPISSRCLSPGLILPDIFRIGIPVLAHPPTRHRQTCETFMVEDGGGSMTHPELCMDRRGWRPGTPSGWDTTGRDPKPEL